MAPLGAMSDTPEVPSLAEFLAARVTPRFNAVVADVERRLAQAGTRAIEPEVVMPATTSRRLTDPHWSNA